MRTLRSYPMILDHDHVLILLLFWSDRLHINHYIRAMWNIMIVVLQKTPNADYYDYVKYYSCSVTKTPNAIPSLPLRNSTLPLALWCGHTTSFRLKHIFYNFAGSEHDHSWGHEDEGSYSWAQSESWTPESSSSVSV